MNYGTGDDWFGRDGLLNFTQLNHILRKYRWQNLSLKVAEALLLPESSEGAPWQKSTIEKLTY